MKTLSSTSLTFLSGGAVLSSTYLGTELISVYPHAFAQKPKMRLAHSYACGDEVIAYAADETADVFIKTGDHYLPDMTASTTYEVASLLTGFLCVVSLAQGIYTGYTKFGSTS